MAINTTNLETVINNKIASATTTTADKDLLLISKSVEALVPTVTVQAVVAEGATQVTAVQAGGATQVTAVQAAGATQVAAVQAAGAGYATSAAIATAVTAAVTDMATNASVATAVANLVADADIGTTVQAYDATIVVDADIGTTVQAYDADTVKAPSGALPALNGAALTGIDSLPAQSAATTDFVLSSDGSNATWAASSGGGGAFQETLSAGAFNLDQYFPTINWDSTNTQSYGWVMQRTVGVAAGDAQFALVQGGSRGVSEGGCQATIFPFQIKADNSFVAGTPAAMWTNTTLSQDFSTSQFITDDRSGTFHYSGNIPWPTRTTHFSGFGSGRLNANNTTDSFQSSSVSGQGIHNGNGQYHGLTDADGEGWRGVIGGYDNSDSKTRILQLEWNANGLTNMQGAVNIYNPSADTSTTANGQHFMQANSRTNNTALSGVTHWRNATGANARVFNGASSSYTDYASNKPWNDVYSTTFFPMVSLSNGKTIVYHGGETWLYTNNSTRTQITAPLPPWITITAWTGASTIPQEADTWMTTSPTSNISELQKWKIDPLTYEWTLIPHPEGRKLTQVGYGSYQSLHQLPNNRVLHMYRAYGGKIDWHVVNVADWTA